jgi:hypothetical protein
MPAETEADAAIERENETQPITADEVIGDGADAIDPESAEKDHGPVPRVLQSHPLLPGHAFHRDVNAMDIEDVEVGKARTALFNTANSGKPLVLYSLERGAGEYDPSRGRRVDVRVPGAVVVAWGDYCELVGRE